MQGKRSILKKMMNLCVEFGSEGYKITIYYARQIDYEFAKKKRIKRQKWLKNERKMVKNEEKCTFFAFFFENIWSCQKKAVPLHSLSKRKYDIRSRCYRLVA